MDSLERLQIYLDQLSENKIFIGLIMVLVNIGARFIIEELSEEHKTIIQNTYFRKLVIFCSVFMATRDIGVALIVTLIFAIVINEILGKEDEDADKDADKDAEKDAIGYKIDQQIELLNSIKDKLKSTIV
tara:strand:+ start:849 stop:1238 length:390 start_codon:yes stop_codon:yes gene_type:complete